MAARALIMQQPNPLVLGAWFDLYDRDHTAAQEKVAKAMTMGSPSGDVLAVAGTVYLLSMKPLEAKKMLAEVMRTTLSSSLVCKPIRYKPRDVGTK